MPPALSNGTSQPLPAALPTRARPTTAATAAAATLRTRAAAAMATIKRARPAPAARRRAAGRAEPHVGVAARRPTVPCHGGGSPDVRRRRRRATRRLVGARQRPNRKAEGQPAPRAAARVAVWASTASAAAQWGGGQALGRSRSGS